MDPRNCTGCGLCAQICPTGALQLFRPEHVAVLISRPGERTDLLKALQIPHLTYDPITGLDLFGWADDCTLLTQAKGFLKGEEQTGKLRDWAVDLWRYRLTKDRLPAQSGLRADSRWRNWIGIDAPERVTADHMRQVDEEVGRRTMELLRGLGLASDMGGGSPTKGQRNSGDITQESVAVRAFIWSQLVWSDPGQVLWDSPIIVARTTATTQDNGGLTWDPPQVEKALNDLGNTKSPNGFSVETHWVVLRRGEVQAGGEDRAIQCSETGRLRLALGENQIKAYATAGLGYGRLLGLDLRACPEMLKKGRELLDKDDVMSVSGLPWKQLRTVPCIRDIEAERDRRLTATRNLRRW
jgi:ferredoxin